MRIRYIYVKDFFALIRSNCSVAFFLFGYSCLFITFTQEVFILLYLVSIILPYRTCILYTTLTTSDTTYHVVSYSSQLLIIHVIIVPITSWVSVRYTNNLRAGLALKCSTSSGIQTMSSLLVSFEEILSDKGGYSRGTQVTCEGSGTGMAEFMSLAFILAKEPRRTDIKQVRRSDKTMTGHSPMRTCERSLVQMTSHMYKNVVAPSIELIAAIDIATIFFC